MTLFLILAGAMLALALLFVLPVLWRRGAGPATVPHAQAPRAALNLAVLRDQLRELDQDLRLGSIAGSAYQHARDELARRVAEETRAQPLPLHPPAPQRWPGAVLALGFSSAAIFLYAALGTPAGLLATPTAPAAPATAGNPPPVTDSQIAAMVQRLADRLKANPDDAEGWRKLARSYETLRRFDLAVQAYARLLALTPETPDLLTDYAVTLAMSQDQRLTGAPEKLIERALRLDPRHIQALALSGSAAFEREDYAGAMAAWEKILANLQPGDEMAASITANISKARALGETAGEKKSQR
jgi:cytochrome c-type biogenesis protein CcmH